MRRNRRIGALALAAGAAALAACGGQEQAGNAEEETAAVPEVERYQAVAVPEGLTWEEARERAEEAGGHLVTITSAEENAAVHALIVDNPDLWVSLDLTVTRDGEEVPLQVTVGPWIGLYQLPDAAEPDGGWGWVTGEVLDYTNWSMQPDVDALEPNDMGGVEDYGQFFGVGLDNRADTWNDLPNDPVADFTAAGVEFAAGVQSPHGYVVEFEE